jgi:hypothetical protein
MAQYGGGRGQQLLFPVILPEFPGRSALRLQVFELLFVFESIHTAPETFIAVGKQLFLGNQALERFHNQFFIRSNILEYFGLKSKIAAVYPDIGLFDIGQRCYQVVFAHRNHMESLAGSDAQEAGNFLVSVKVVHEGRQVQVGQAVRVIG